MPNSLTKIRSSCHKSTEDSVRLRHGGLDVNSLEVLPALLQKRDQEVKRHVNILSDLFFSQGIGSNGGSETDDLLKLESDGRL